MTTVNVCSSLAIEMIYDQLVYFTHTYPEILRTIKIIYFKKSHIAIIQLKHICHFQIDSKTLIGS